MIANSALARSTRHIVLHAIASKHTNTVVVHAHGEVHREFALRYTQDLTEVLFETHSFGRQVKLFLGDLVRCFLRHNSSAETAQTSTTIDSTIYFPPRNLSSTTS